MLWILAQLLVCAFLTFAAVGCSAPVKKASPPPVPSATARNAQPAVSRSTPAPPAPALLEGRDGIAGQPRDDTAFEYEVELPAPNDEPPLLDGVPPASNDIKRTLGAYLDARRARLVGTSASDGLLVLTRLGETTHAHRVARPLAQREQVTFGPEPVEQASFVPTQPRLLTYRVDTSGNEDYQVLMLGLDTRSLSLLSDGRTRHGPFRWSSKGRYLAFSALSGEADTRLLVRSSSDQQSRTLTEKPGQWVVSSWSRDESELLAQEYVANDESRLHVVDVSTGVTQALSSPEPGVVHRAATFTPDAKAIYMLSNREGEFVQLWRHERRDATWKRLTDATWDVEEFSQSSDGNLIAYTLNADGFSRLWLLNLTTGRRTKLQGLPDGVLSGLRFYSPTRLAFSLSTATSPMDAFTYDIKTADLVRWTRSETGGVPAAVFVSPRLIRFPSFDGREIPAFLYEPRGPGPFPTLIWVHGGPEGQSRPEFDPIIQYFAGRLGIAVVAPNIRGSDGYGKSYLALDDREKRFDAIRDIGYLLDWIDRHASLDAGRVGIYGGSYGGYVVLASLVEYGRRIRAGCDVVGISNFATFLENTSQYRRDIRRREYGDERESGMRELLDEISPFNHAERIESALFVAHGANDPRVPVAEAEAIVERVRAAGRPAWYLLARSEGHIFRKRTNRDRFYQAMASFFAEHLLGDPTPKLEVEDVAMSPPPDDPTDSPKSDAE